ncbi:MAG TPA: hypothetical protein PLU70_00100 [Thermotogota bacterium]|jgi:hypothetical protein|nr:hypothetical protein [Thermotogota bacterium]NLH20180.1 hypothetical protein [Thermotogaceae bacterium]OQC32966.1 MAG: Zc3h12a-like Ribonuclease NYN domain protein [Thermotogota bacterium ADurb.Bin062]HNW46532.1 hypothetical protein [Thermotogota bacterium]HNY81610.1 hypothetical protein [Thermotogota bacterium]
MRRVLADVLYHPEYLNYLKELRLTSSFVCGELSQSNIRKISAEGLFYVFNRCDQKMAKRLASQELLVLKFGLEELLFTKEPFEKRLREVSELFGLTDWDLAPLLFYTAPSFFFLPREEVRAYVENRFRISTKDSTFYHYNQQLKKAFEGSEEQKSFRKPMEFVAAVMTFFREEERRLELVDKEDSRILEEMADSLLTIDPFRIDPKLVSWLKDLYDSFTETQKGAFRELATRKRLHPYIRRLVTDDERKGAIIDGSNLMMAGLYKPDPRRFLLLLNVMGVHKPLLFPFLIIFDANADHLVQTDRDFWETRFLNNPSVIFHSPADEWILKFAQEKRCAVISNDRFRDYERSSVEILRFAPEKGKLYLT